MVIASNSNERVGDVRIKNILSVPSLMEPVPIIQTESARNKTNPKKSPSASMKICMRRRRLLRVLYTVLKRVRLNEPSHSE